MSLNLPICSRESKMASVDREPPPLFEDESDEKNGEIPEVMIICVINYESYG